MCKGWSERQVIKYLQLKEAYLFSFDKDENM